MLRTTIIPRLAERRLNGAEEPIRIWSVGCATGEEPYSLAMLFAEVMGTEAFANRVKIYATDLDEAALHVARHAAYAPRDVEGVPAELLTRYFERTNNHYVFARELRKSVIFGRHNVARDAPISRADMVVCRNLLIYLETETQDLVLPRLHYALRDDGFLFLGKAETQLARSRLFEPVDLKHRDLPEAAARVAAPRRGRWWRPFRQRRPAERPARAAACAAAGRDRGHLRGGLPGARPGGRAGLRQLHGQAAAGRGRGRYRAPVPGPRRVLPPGGAARPHRGSRSAWAARCGWSTRSTSGLRRTRSA